MPSPEVPTTYTLTVLGASGGREGGRRLAIRLYGERCPTVAEVYVVIAELGGDSAYLTAWQGGAVKTRDWY